MEKRTTRIDNEREVYIGPGPEGVPIHTTKGDMALTGEEKEELREKLDAQQHEARVQKAIALLEENAAKFGEMVFFKVAPASVYEAQFHPDDVAQRIVLHGWINENRFQVFQDGMTTFVKCKGDIVATMTAKTENMLPEVRKAVEERLKRRSC